MFVLVTTVGPGRLRLRVRDRWVEGTPEQIREVFKVLELVDPAAADPVAAGESLLAQLRANKPKG